MRRAMLGGEGLRLTRNIPSYRRQFVAKLADEVIGHLSAPRDFQVTPMRPLRILQKLSSPRGALPQVEPSAVAPVAPLNQAREDSRMMKTALAVSAAAALLTTAPIVTPAKAVKVAQGVDVQIGRDRDDRYDGDDRQRFDRQHFDSDTTVGIGPGGVTIGPRERCRIETTTNERDGRWLSREERRCD